MMMLAETQTYIERLREMRGNALHALDGSSGAALNWKPTRRETNSPFALATHLIGSERYWIHRIVGGRTIQRDRDAEFRARGSDAQSLRAEFDAVARESETILGALSANDLDAQHETNSGARSVRWGILHLLEHYSEHVGQMTLTRQVWEAQARSKKPKAKSVKRKTRKAKRKK
jgi:uncharacterized damage-inducible protein DinB